MITIKKIIIMAIGIFTLFWVGSILKCEYLTFKFGHEFEKLGNPIMSEYADCFKVLGYEENSAKVYYAKKDDKDKHNGYGNIHLYHKENDEWVDGDMFFTIWSSAGSADKIFWPYIR